MNQLDLMQDNLLGDPYAGLPPVTGTPIVRTPKPKHKRTLAELLSLFPSSRRMSNKWPGLRVAPSSYETFRVVLEGERALIKGVKGNGARRTYATIDLSSGAVSVGSWDRDDQLAKLLRELWEDPDAFVGKHGKERCMCCFCYSPLSTPESLERGYGPVCASHYGLPWGSL